MRTALCVAVVACAVLPLGTSRAAQNKLEDADRELLDAVARLAAEVETGVVNDWTLRAVAFSNDPRGVDVLLSVLELPESSARCGADLYWRKMAADGLGRTGDARAIPGLKRFLASRLGADTLDPASLPYGGTWPTGADVNHYRAEEALAAAKALYALGDWRTALAALARLVREPHDPRFEAHFLSRAAQLDARRYASDPEATDSTVAFLRRACADRRLMVRADAAVSLAELDPELAFRTATELIATGPDADSGHPAYLAHHKVTALVALAASGLPEARAKLLALAQEGTPLLRASAQRALEDWGRGER